MSGLFSFRKDERLSSKKLIQALFQRGTSFYVAPYKVIFLFTSLPTAKPAQVIITASKKNFRKATSRNSVRRVIREAYRLNKGLLYDVLRDSEKQCAIALIYTGKTIPEADTTGEKILAIIERLIQEAYEAHP
jgi:ribonuclease P protein component